MFRFAGTYINDLNYPAILSIIALGLIVHFFLARPVSRKTFLALIALFATAAVFIGFAPVLIPNSLRPSQQFQARAWIGLLPVGLALAMVALQRQNAQRSAVSLNEL